MKIEPSQQIKFPLDGIILTANDINQVFYVHRAVKFIHAHICLNPVAIWWRVANAMYVRTWGLCFFPSSFFRCFFWFRDCLRLLLSYLMLLWLASVCVALVLICFNAEIPTHAHSHRTEWCIMEFSLLKLTPCADFDEQINMKLRFHSSSILELLWCDVNVNADTPQKPFTFFFPSPHREHFPDNVLMLFQAENVVIILVTLPYDLTFKNVHHFSIPRRKWANWAILLNLCLSRLPASFADKRHRNISYFSLIMMKAKHQAWFAGWHITHNSWTHIIHAWCSLRPHFIWCRYVKWIIRKLHIKMRIQSKTCYFVYMNC